MPLGMKIVLEKREQNTRPQLASASHTPPMAGLPFGTIRADRLSSARLWDEFRTKPDRGNYQVFANMSRGPDTNNNPQ